MAERDLPWYVRWVVGIGAWITAVVMMVLGGAIVFVALDIESAGTLAIIGAFYLWAGVWIVRQPDRGTFASQIGIATAAAGAALVAVGLAVEAEEVWVGIPVALAIAAAIFVICESRTLQFLAAALAGGFFIATLMTERIPYMLDIAALATPAGLYLLLNPTKRDLTAAAIVLFLLFPIFSVFILPDLYWTRSVEAGGWFARAVHIILFIWLVNHGRLQSDVREAQPPLVVFTVVAVLVCVILPPGGSAALVVMTYAYVTGHKPFALLGVLLQAQFIVRYYYDLDLDLLNKSLLLMAIGAILIGAWWFLQHERRAGGMQ